MASETILVAVDGSDASLHAVTAGLALLSPDAHVVFVTVVEASDPTLVTGAGMAGGVMSADELDEMDAAQVAEGRADVEAAQAAVGRAGSESVVARGVAGPTLCDLAKDRSAAAIVMGSRGRGGIKRALLGSVSDHVVRNAPCPVVITGPAD